MLAQILQTFRQRDNCNSRNVWRINRTKRLLVSVAHASESSWGAFRGFLFNQRFSVVDEEYSGKTDKENQ